jgi:hypothetical protein
MSNSYQANKDNMPDAYDLASAIGENLGESWVPPSWPMGDGDGEDYEMSDITYGETGWTFTFRNAPGEPALRITVKEEK